MKLATTVTAVSLCLFSLFAQATVITFDNEIPETKPSPYIVDGVAMYNSGGLELVVSAFSESNGSMALAVYGDDANGLILYFPEVINFLSLDFGNDDPANTNAGDSAMLSVYLDNALVGQTAVALNRNDLVDQTITFSGIEFNAAVFQFTDSTGSQGINVLEIVDNITFYAGETPAPIPEPGGLALLGLASLAAAISRRTGAAPRRA